MQNTISIHVGNTSSIIHNNRKTENHTNPDIDVSRSGDNIVLVQENIKISYEKLFGQAVDEYNAKQKRADRKINNYLQKVKDSALDHQKEFILQIGDYQSLEKLAEAQGCKIWETQEWQLRAETLKQAVLNFQVQNPNLYVYNAIIHLDELNPHAHVNFIPVGDNMKKGMNKQVSMNRALENMGYDAKFEVSSEAKNVKERGRIKLNNSENFKNWRDDNLERVKEIAKEVYQKAGQTFDFVEGDKTNQHESVQAYKRTIEAAKEKSREIIKQAEKDAKTAQEELREQAYYLWVDDWKTTKSKFEDFELELNPFNWDFDGFNSALDREQQEKGSIKVDEQTPRRFNFSFSELKELFKVKLKVLTKYINSKWQHLSRREVEIEKMENTLTEKEKGLESKLEDLNNEIEVKQQSLNRMSKALNVEMGKVHATRALINAGDEIIGKLKESESDIKINKPLFSEKTVTMPYAKYEKMRIANWQNPFRSAYVEFEKNSSELVERMANREGILQEKVSNLRKENSTLSKEKSSLSREKSQYQSDYIALNNTVIALVNEDKLSIKDLERHVETLPQTFITDYDIPVPEKEAPKPRRTHNLDKGFGLSL